MSLRLKLLLALVPLFVLGLVAANVGTYAALHSFLLSRLDEQILSSHQYVGDVVSHGCYDSGRGPGPNGGGSGLAPGLPIGTYGEIRTPSGTTVASCLLGRNLSTSAHPVVPTDVRAGTQSSPNFLTVPGSGNSGDYRVYVDSADSAGDILLVGIPLSDVNSTLSRLLAIELGISGGVTLVLVAATWFIVRRSLRPLVRMAGTARSIAAHDLSPRVEPANDRTEVGRLGLALNTMLDQLENAFAERARNEERLRHFVSDASHELRTPLTSMRGYAELFRRNPDMDPQELAMALRRVEEEAQRMGVLVDDLLLLARLDQGRPLEHRPVDLEALIADACADARVADPGRTITMRAGAPLMVTGDDMRLRQVLGNLLTNARVHTPAGTPIEVELHHRDGRAVLDVIDHGPGIPVDDRSRIFERFHRAEPGRSRDQGGSGLGLSIVAAVVTAHGGTFAVVDTPGGGATFRIELPLTGTHPPAPDSSSETTPASSGSRADATPPAPTRGGGAPDSQDPLSNPQGA